MMFKRWMVGIIVLALLAGASAMAEFVPLDGSIVSSGAEAVRAPFGGIIEDVHLRAGDLIHVGDPVATIVTSKVYAPEDGVVGSVCAQEGDGTDGIIKRYGAVLYIEPMNRYIVTASTEKAYNSSTTKYVHIGEKVYLSCTQDGSHCGTAKVTKIEAADEAGNTKYALEVTGGDFYIGETVGVFRSSDYAPESRIGRGTVAQNAAIAVEGSGSLLRMHVSAGDVVERGQLLFETVDGTLDGLYAGENTIPSDVSGIVASVDVQNGGAANKDGNLITVYPLESLQVEARVYVMDLSSIAVGDAVEIEFDFDPDGMDRYPGVVESISYVSSGEENQKYYNAYISFAADESVRLGMPVIVYPRAAEAAEEGVHE